MIHFTLLVRMTCQGVCSQYHSGGGRVARHVGNSYMYYGKEGRKEMAEDVFVDPPLSDGSDGAAAVLMSTRLIKIAREIAV